MIQYNKALHLTATKDTQSLCYIEILEFYGNFLLFVNNFGKVVEFTHVNQSHISKCGCKYEKCNLYDAHNGKVKEIKHNKNLFYI